MRTLAYVVLAAAGLAGDWTLPRTQEVKEQGPRTYRFTNLYTATNPTGEVVQRHQLTAAYTRGLPGGEVEWHDVVARVALGPTAPFPDGERRTFMEGLRYPRGSSRIFEPDFFQAFPPAAVHERNLVWDVVMLEAFGEQQFPHLRLNQPYQVARRQDLALPGIGSFQNRDVRLTWVGRSRRNGVDCAVIDYTAFFNPLRIDAGGVRIAGLSHYWGQIWVATATRMVEYATIREVVYGEMSLPGQEAAQPMNVFRESVLEPAGR